MRLREIETKPTSRSANGSAEDRRHMSLTTLTFLELTFSDNNRGLRHGLRAVALLTIVLLAGLTGCGEKQEAAEDGAIRVVATTGMIADAVRDIAGDRVELYAMMGPGVDPHMYKATKQDIDQLDAADAIFYNGLHLEAKLGEILEKMGTSRMVVAVGDV
ncbi:hypothetical protein GF377_05330, partial [candidate division GN15 bacterium]|nr:hypothetical protein [candidate division GN15 bacterium]